MTNHALPSAVAPTADEFSEIPAPTAGASLREAARDAGVVWAGLFVLGVGFGVLVTGHGFAWWWAPIISAAVFAGSVEFILIGMLAASAPIASIAVTTFLVNSRHLFYGISFPLHRVRGRLAKAYSVYALVDEAFAVLSSRDPKSLSSSRILWTQVGLHASWVTGGLLGALAGASLLSEIEGMEFVLTALFVVLTIDAYRDTPDRVALALAVSAAILAQLLAPGSMLLLALLGYTTALVVRSRLNQRQGDTRV